MCNRALKLMLSLGFCLAVVLIPTFTGAGAAENPDKVRIVLVGDSTVTDKGGWGGAFAGLLKPSAECVNLARSGHSSKSYYDKGYWKQVLERKPAFVLIQ